MTLPIITSEKRKQEKRGIKGIILGKSGIGKTSLLWSLPSENTLFIDLEAGDLCVSSWKGDALRPRTWVELRDLACLIGGANPVLKEDQPYSQAHYASVMTSLGEPAQLDKYDIFFIDSLTTASRLCLEWCATQPQSVSEKTGKPDLRALYGLLSREFIQFMLHLQQARLKHMWFTCILEEKRDELNQLIYQLQMEGSKPALELPGIVDLVLTLAGIKDKGGNIVRALTCYTINPYHFPAKDRSGRLALYEKAHLGDLLQKITAPYSRELTNNLSQGETS